MGKIVLITGGARSGKSTYAEKLATEAKGRVLYIATSIPFDDEMKDRVKKHKERRPDTWKTFEGYKDLKQVFYNHEIQFDAILLDCITIMVTNLMFENSFENFDDLGDKEIDKMEEGILQEISDFLGEAEKSSKEIIIVTNELGSGIVPENKMARVFRDIAGRVNQYIASRAQEVYMVVCGIQIKIK
ncbi:bifunctional adenosylcobinamide kinase/adenosylcobinamide-phosphate guanylyltransferase [Clostridium lacusfryxellense]|uniref:bifunctional adenosylcobinamide kinase/adenosylcobinamide-phosphate guanylyltransferase n=1 Tax=Clostridium lacusfryxellense TaxID=205328 RepID=UPI001C0AF9C6|nr:bifunctional adenosylcobinamide kinase/adenosylcobinamide-phosphate guanylyltransferase [Clostridium lacusfryxellense]MBU3113471.1 bifunctional adenosylcobinamide kinase/adenosylcobinamide-phosphate guanylyltransferase [Clostridium lacusfryxellense]